MTDQLPDPSLSAVPDGRTYFDEYASATQRMLDLGAAGAEPELPIPACPQLGLSSARAA